MSYINFKEIIESTRVLSPLSELAFVVGLKGAINELDPYTVDPAVVEFLARVEEIGGEFIAAIEDAGLL